MARDHLLLVACIAAAPCLHASAQQAREFNPDLFSPATTAEGIIQVESGFVPSEGQWDLRLWADRAASILSIPDGEKYRAALRKRDRLTLIGAYSIGPLQLGIRVPTVTNQQGEPSLGYEALRSGIENLQLVPKVRILGRSAEDWSLSAVARLSFPSALPEASLLGRRATSGEAYGALSRRWGTLRVAANLGVQHQPALRNADLDLELSDSWVARVGAEIDLDALDLPLAIAASASTFTPLREPFASGTARSNRTELLGQIRGRLTPSLSIGIGAGRAIKSSVATGARERVFAMLALHERFVDRDRDGIEDSADRCLRSQEDVDGHEDSDGCPDLDNDLDGVLDTQDLDPDHAEDLDGFEDEDGIPENDNDQDGILDQQDGAPNEPEDMDGFDDHDGIPDPDNDRDGIADDVDLEPNDPEDLDGFEDEDGRPDPDNDADGILDVDDACPRQPGIAEAQGCQFRKVVVVRSCDLTFDTLVRFDPKTRTMTPKSAKALTRLADLLNGQTQIKRLRVEGHTDSVGPRAANLRISRRRAQRVVSALIKRGVSAQRLEAEGVGEARPIADNRKPAGRAMNRRVEFHIDACVEERDEILVTTPKPEETMMETSEDAPSLPAAIQPSAVPSKD